MKSEKARWPYLLPGVLIDENAAAEHLESQLSSGRGPGEQREAGRPLLVCFSHLRWGFVWQRPQHLLCRAVRDFDVVFIEEPVFEATVVDSLRVERVDGGVEVVVPVLSTNGLVTAEARLERLLRDFLKLRSNTSRIFWYYTPAAVAFSASLQRDVTVYDNMDELSAFRGASADLVAQEQLLLGQADIVFTGGRSLYEAKRKSHANIHCFPSSVDTRHFHRARCRNLPDPADQSTLPRPRLGFFGVIDERFDRDFLTDLADLRPDWQWVMIGPVVKIDPASLPQRPNIHWLGPKSYAELPDYLSHWDVGLMPFALNESTRFISPTKTPEFLAAGLPVISTPIVDVVRSYGDEGLVEIADTPVIAVLTAEALMARPKERWLEQVDGRLAANSWDQTWDAMRALIANRLPSSNISYDEAAQSALIGA